METRQLNWFEYESKQNQKLPYILFGVIVFLSGMFISILYGGWYWLIGFVYMNIGIWGAWYKCNQIDKIYDKYLKDKQEGK